MNRLAPRFALAGLLVVASASVALAQSEDALIKYFRKKNNLPPTAAVTVQGLKDSANFKGSKEGTLNIAGPQGNKALNFIASPDLKYVVVGEVVDTTVDPSKAVMAKINLQGEPFKGAKDAKVTIVEYSEFQCPFCKRGFDTIENQVLKQYEGKVKFYFKSFPLPFHPWAMPASIAAECAKSQKAEAFWKVYESFFNHQSEINPQNVKDKAAEYLKDTGIDMAKWNTCFDNKETAAKVNKEHDEGAALGVTGTPAFFINGRMLVGAQPFEQFKNVIDDELAAAK
ncbi:MAG: DsbA family protein [Deltaproteobacteria bacterium]|nr:DsbA family protein [Deltaproteobacteria bacterium]